MKWNGHKKSHTSIVVGASPEFEMAVLTICFTARYKSQVCPIRLNGINSKVMMWPMAGVSPTTIGTAYITCLDL